MDTYSLLFGNPRIYIRELPIEGATYKDVARQFTSQWKHATRVPTVLKVWRINVDRSLAEGFISYQQKVALRTRTLDGNTRRRFHGTTRSCTLGDDEDDTDLCNMRSCSLCRIIQRSFEIARVGENTNFARFGVGIYTSATSSKAHDYSTSYLSSANAMLLNEVVMGRAIKLTRTDTSLTKPPLGYDSVIGEPGEDLNYDEAVVYNQDAIRPTFLIIHQEQRFT